MDMDDKELDEKYEQAKREVEAFEEEQDSPYISYKSTIYKLIERIDELETRINRLAVDYKDSQRDNAVGVQNVYTKFLEFEARQRIIEELFKSDKIQELIKTIPNENDISNLLVRIEGTEIGKLNKHLRRIRDDLEELSGAFNY